MRRESDFILRNFLHLLEKDMKYARSFNSDLIHRIVSLTAGVDVDLDALLDEKDE